MTRSSALSACSMLEFGPDDAAMPFMKGAACTDSVTVSGARFSNLGKRMAFRMNTAAKIRAVKKLLSLQFFNMSFYPFAIVGRCVPGIWRVLNDRRSPRRCSLTG